MTADLRLESHFVQSLELFAIFASDDRMCFFHSKLLIHVKEKPTIFLSNICIYNGSRNYKLVLVSTSQNFGVWH